MDLDRYYTPPIVARTIVEATGARSMRSCVDSACGSGSLLRASEEVFPGVCCVGIDKDKGAISRLKMEKPRWILAAGDMLRWASWPQSVLKHGRRCDYVLINPPFSTPLGKSVGVQWRDENFRCSVAMSHLLATLECFAPRLGGVAILPESLMFSELDAPARAALAAAYEVELVRELRSSTFRGARANALVLRVHPKERVVEKTPRESHDGFMQEIHVIRGGLPLFEARADRFGLRLIHSTDIREVARTGRVGSTKCVRPIGRGCVQGSVILLPRVGMPSPETLKPVVLQQAVQLSDCVIALQFRTARDASAFSAEARRRWPEFLGLYHGTGARYITVGRLLRWLGPRACPGARLEGERRG